MIGCTTGGTTTPGGFDPGQVDAAPAGDPLDTLADPLSPQNGFKVGAEQMAALCARGNGDAVSKAFCATGTPPAITSIVDLQKLLGLDFKAGQTGNGKNGNPAFVLTGHSSSLVTHFTSAINPRAIIFTPPNSTGRVNAPAPLASFTVMGFVRGEGFVELISNDPTANGGAGDLNFFLFRFNRPCDGAGCTFDELLTPKVESGFTGYSLYQDVDIKNTIFDCLQCHQTGGPASQKILRMQELQNPWGHFFRNNRANGQALLADYAAAHAVTEDYAGIPGAAITNSDPAQLEGLVENQGFQKQPNEFNTGKILDQGESATWMTLYTNSMASMDIPPPFHENRVSDPAKLAAATAAYQAAMAGTPLTMDIREIFLDAGASDMTFRPATSLVTANDGKGIMVQICQQCHNPSLDQTLSRAKFDVTKLSTMTREEKDKAIKRLNLDDTAFRRMPPPRFRGLSAAEINLVVQELQK
jgi:mono/diheme cytochrome c family protein